jgi:hypothetical protein
MNSGRIRLATSSSVVILTIATFWMLGFWFLHAAVGGFYHPNTFMGAYGSKYVWIFAFAISLNWLFTIYIAIRGSLETKLKKLGVSAFVFLLLVAGFFLALLIPTNHRVEYYIGQQKYSVPWQYNPHNGRSVPYGKSISIHVSYPDFSGEFSTENFRKSGLTLVKKIYDDDSMKGIGNGISLDTCAEEACGGLGIVPFLYFVEDGFMYTFYYHGDSVRFRDKVELGKFKKSVTGLFASFKTK